MRFIRSVCALAALSSAVAGGFVACESPTAPPGEPQGGGSTGGEGAGSASGAGSAPGAPGAPVAVADHPRVVDTRSARIFSASAAADRAAQDSAGKIRPMTASANWTVTTGKPVAGTPAVYGPSFTTESASDQMFFSVNATGAGVGLTGGVAGSLAAGGVCGASACSGFDFIVLNNLYTSTPSVSWVASLGGSSTDVALSGNGTKLYVLSNAGKLNCLLATSTAPPAATFCSGWTAPTISITSAVTPWVDSSLNAVYVADAKGAIYKFDATTGVQTWKYTYTASASSAWPVEADGVIYIGDSAGILYRIVDPGSSAPTSARTSGALNGASCGGAQSITGSVSLDTTVNKVFLPNQQCLYSFPHVASGSDAGTWGVTASAWSASQPDKTFQTWATLDGTYAYWVMADIPTSFTPVSSVWKAPYNLASVKGSTLTNASSTVPGATVTAAPLLYSGSLYVGDQSGFVERFGCASSSFSTTEFTAYTSSVGDGGLASGAKVNTGIILDNATGNINYGFTTAAGTGGVAQFPLSAGSASSFTWNCPSGMVPCDSQLCGAGASKTACVPKAECNTGVSCSTVAAAGGTLQCASAAEGAAIQGTNSPTHICPTGKVILGVVAASYGTPVSGCPQSGDTFSFGNSCYANDSLSITQSSCPLDTSRDCTLTAGNSTFGDPCVGTGKTYGAWFVCGNSKADAAAVPVFCSTQNLSPLKADGGLFDGGSASDPCNTKTGQCEGTCSSGWGDCNNNLQYDGCETYVSGTDTSNCGSCGNGCVAGHSCLNGVCQ